MHEKFEAVLLGCFPKLNTGSKICSVSGAVCDISIDFALFTVNSPKQRGGTVQF